MPGFFGTALTFGIVLSTGTAMANPVEDAQTYVVQQTSQGVNVLANGCSKLSTKNGKNVCFLKAYPAVALIGYANGRKKDAVQEEYQTLATLNQWNVASTIVGSAFINKLGCSAADTKFGCGGFTEQKLTGTEVYWAGYQHDLVETQTVKSCTAASYQAKVESAYKNTSLNGLNLHSFVHGKSEHWREELSGDVTSMGQTFAHREAAVIDLQAFVADDGNMAVFDPQGLSKDKKFYTCWSSALVIFGQLIYADK
ncbi:MAG TPA: hypothetical protein VM661_04705 [Candidatus Sulfotelmatobacter sp.]|nr:hypothetical protein [Candidatus Sulfotelmatobacter sp.]